MSRSESAPNEGRQALCVPHELRRCAVPACVKHVYSCLTVAAGVPIIDNASVLDCLVVGAGPAGLTAATYLKRFHREITVVDAGKSRARWIPKSHNCPGFPFGVVGTDLLQKFRTQAASYGASIEAGHVALLQREGSNFRAVADDGTIWRARFVVLATGVVDRMPAMRGLEEAIAGNVLRVCAVCDGYEASDEDIAVYGPADAAIGHALFLRTFSSLVSVVCSSDEAPSADLHARARAAGIAVLPAATALRHEAQSCVFELADGEQRRFDTVYPALGATAQSELARKLGADVDDNGELVVDERMQCSVDGLYAIGDVVSALNQISVAVGHAAIAATAIHNRLPSNFRRPA